MVLNLSQCLRLDTQISTSVRMTVGNWSNKDDSEGLSRFGWKCSVLVQRCILSGDAKNSRNYFLLSARLHTVFLVKLRGVVMFSEMSGVFVNDAKNCVCVLLIYVCGKYSESHMAGFLGEILCTSSYGCIFVFIEFRHCRQSRVTWGGIFGWWSIYNYLVIFIRTNIRY